MSTKDTATDPATPAVDHTMIPGDPACNYTKFMAAQPKSIINIPSDQRNPQYRSARLSFNGHSLEVPFDKPTPVPRPYAVQAILSGIASTTDESLLKELDGQITVPQTGPLRGPLSGSYADDRS